MIIRCQCNETEYRELIKQLNDEGLRYTATIQTTLDEVYEDRKYVIVFWYSGKLI